MINSTHQKNEPVYSELIKAKEDVLSNFFGHAFFMLDHLRKQNEAASLAADKSDESYGKAFNEINKLHSKLHAIISSLPESNKENSGELIRKWH